MAGRINPVGQIESRTMNQFTYDEMTTRNRGFVNEEEQARLRDGHVFIPGVGGMGSSLKYSFRFGCIRSDRIIILPPSAWPRGTPAASCPFVF